MIIAGQVLYQKYESWRDLRYFNDALFCYFSLITNQKQLIILKMAKIVKSTRNPVFEAVFPKKSIHSPEQFHQFESKRKRDLKQIELTLTEHLRPLLGIGDENFIYGTDQSTSEGEPYYTYFDICQPMNQIRQPSSIDNSIQNGKLSNSKIWHLLELWQRRIGSEQIKRLLADILDKLISEFIKWSYSGCYDSDVELHLTYWVENIFTRIISQILSTTNNQKSKVFDKRWEETALTRLGALRVDELFDMIVSWDQGKNGIDELKRFVSNPATRSYLTTNFSTTLNIRALHPGASTIEILQIYISTIRAFRKLDPRGVLLDRVGRKLRRYLREREDTVKVIVTGLLSDITDENGESISDPEILTELAIELSNPEENKHDEEFDWDNMSWIPDPIDAAPDYIKMKNTDIIGSLISLFESKDIFVRELQSTMAERLLKNKSDFDQEIRILEHLKLRLGDASLQKCEVMLRDVLDSRKLDLIIRRDQGMDKNQLHAKVLSRLFWPTMSEQSFKIPNEIIEQQNNYEKGFESLKQTRKLTWLNSIGHVEVEIDLEDRTFYDEVLPWQATIIYQFQGQSSISKTVSELSSTLEMSTALVRSACIFWVSKRILSEISPDKFIVIEKLPDGNDIMMTDVPIQNEVAILAAEAAAEEAAKEVEEEERKQKMSMYHQFIVSMLTNQGSMPLPRIAMMLGIVVPGGFPFNNEELKEFLTSMVKDGILEQGHGGTYKAVS